MSGWMVIVRDLYDAGGGPLQREQFDRHYAGGLTGYAFTRAKDLGMMESHQKGYKWWWALTQLGRDWCEGRVEVEGAVYGPGGKREGTTKATWLMALPKPGEVVL